jgi:hypothetical protein
MALRATVTIFRPTIRKYTSNNSNSGNMKWNRSAWDAQEAMIKAQEAIIKEKERYLTDMLKEKDDRHELQLELVCLNFPYHP